MKTYIGTKVIKAKPMNRQEYNDYRGWDLPADEDGADAGYLVEYTDGGKSNHPGHDGYISWSPEDVFGRAYKILVDDYRSRLIDEGSELKEKIVKLREFIHSETFEDLDTEYKSTTVGIF